MSLPTMPHLILCSLNPRDLQIPMHSPSTYTPRLLPTTNYLVTALLLFRQPQVHSMACSSLLLRAWNTTTSFSFPHLLSQLSADWSLKVAQVLLLDNDNNDNRMCFPLLADSYHSSFGLCSASNWSSTIPQHTPTSTFPSVMVASPSTGPESSASPWLLSFVTLSSQLSTFKFYSFEFFLLSNSSLRWL